MSDDDLEELEFLNRRSANDPPREIAPAKKPAVAPTEAATAEYGSGSLMSFLGDDDPGDDGDAWLVDGVIAAGVPQMIAGHPKAKKTFLAEHLALCIAAGMPWLGRKTVRGRVLILPREDSVRETRRRVWRLARGLGIELRNLEGWLRIDALKPFYWADPDHYGALHTTIDSFKPSLIVIDSLSRTHMGDENSVKEMAVVTNRWSDTCQEKNVAVAIIHHFTKSGSGTLLQQLRGSGNIGATLRHLVGVEKSEDRDGPFELDFDGNLHPLPAKFAVQMLDALDAQGRKVIRFDLIGKSDPLSTGEVGKIVDYLAHGAMGNPKTKQELRKASKAGTVQADVAIRDLERGGLIRQSKHGRKSLGYVLTESGKEFANGL